MKVSEVGEQGLLRILQGFCPPEIIGDDGAVLSGFNDPQSNLQNLQHNLQAVQPQPYALVVTTDLLIDGVHFSDRTTSPRDAGWRSAAANLSDLAAMGAEPLGITVGLGLPGETPVPWLEELYRGMTECLQQFSTPIVGGDVVRSSVITIAITAFGRVDPQRSIKRSGAIVGDAIVITGTHGKSKAGLELLLHPEDYGQLAVESRHEMIKAHQRPQPRLDVLPYLANYPRVAGMDSSDGLADALWQVCRASQVGAEIDRTSLAIPPSLLTMTSAPQALDWVLYGGEDFELVLCLPWEQATFLVKQLGQGATIIGNITDNPNIILCGEEEIQNISRNLNQEKGFHHFQ
jgi:thiamine-monophosphate kinase